MSALFLVQTYGGMSQKTGARFEASYHCINTRYHDANTVLCRYGMRTERSRKDREIQGKGGEIYLFY